MASIQDQYDSMLLGILQNERQIVNFLDVCFSFLYRRTDFFVRMKSPTDKMGFPEGVAEKLVLQSFRKQDCMRKKQPIPCKPEKKEPERKIPAKTEPTASECDEPPTPANLIETMETEKTSEGDSQLPAENSEHSSDETNKEMHKSPDVPPTEEQQHAIFQANPDSYNGAIRDKYSWSQSITDVDVKIWVPDSVRKGKDVHVNVDKKHLVVRSRQPSGDMCTLIDGDLMWEVHKEECIWSLEPGKCILVNLEKVQERWWEAILTDEDKINVQKIDPSRPMTDLDDEAQAKIEEMMYNERQKKMGLPQSHEQKVHGMLKNAWDAEGSPFKGQPFDPSKLNISPNNMSNFNT